MTSTTDSPPLERAFVPLLVFAVVSAVASVGLDLGQLFSGIGVGVFPFAALGPALGAGVAWFAYRTALKPLLPPRVVRRQVIAHLVLGIAAAVVLSGILLAVLALAGVTWPAAGFGVAGVPFALTIAGVMVAAALQEIGMRGFAQPILEFSGSRLLATILVGLAWGFWVVQLFPMENTALTVGAVVLAVAAFSVLLGYLGNGSIGQRLAVTVVVHAVVASVLTMVTGGAAVTQPVALALLTASVLSTGVFMAMFAAAQRRRTLKRAAAETARTS